MNRKLLNGLLVIALAAGGVGTFTSCKDDDNHNPIVINSDKIEAIRNVTDEQFKQNLLTWLNNLTNGSTFGTNSEFASYQDFVDKMSKLQSIYDGIIAGDYTNENATEYVDALYDFLYNEKFVNEPWFKNMQANTDLTNFFATYLAEQQKKQVTSLGISQTVNPVFGTINLPVGLNSMVLASYYYDNGGDALVFPSGAYGKLAQAVKDYNNYEAIANAFDVIETIAPDETLANGQFTATEEGDGNMGNAYVTVNPSGVDYSGLQLEVINSKNEVVLGSENLVVTENTDELNFGLSRADGNASTNLYKVQANATAANYEALKFDFENRSELVNALKNLIKNRTKSDIAGLSQAIYDNVQNIMPALALRVSWSEAQMPTTSIDPETGELTYTYPNEPAATRSVVSDYKLAATVMHPLSYSTPIGQALGGLTSKRLPHISPLSYYLEKLGNKLTLSFDDVEGIEGIDDIELQVEFATQGGSIIIAYQDANGEVVYSDPIPYGSNGLNANPQALENFVNAIITAVNAELNYGLKDKLVAQLNGVIDNLNEQLKSVSAELGNIQDYLKELENSKKLAYAQKLVDVYNRVADRVNDFLASPDNYLQVMMAFDGTDGDIHHASTDPFMGYNVNKSAVSDKGLKLYTTSYTGDVVVPSYKKYVAITSVNGSTANLKSINEKAGLNKVYSGTQQFTYMDVTDLSGLVELTYVSVDYRGNCSAQTYYFNIQ